MRRKGNLAAVPVSGDVLGTADDVLVAWRIMAGGVPDTARELLRISTQAQSEFVRVQAAQLVLAAVGLTKGEGTGWLTRATEPDHQDELTGAAVVRSRLALLAPPPVDPEDESPDGIIAG